MSAVTRHSAARLPSLVKQAAAALARAETAAEVLAAAGLADAVYAEAKRAARLAKAKDAHDELVAAAHRAQADALEIESLAKRRLADEYDAAQARGDVATKGKPKNVSDGNIKATAEDIGLSAKQVFDARQIRDAVAQDPGIVRRVLDDMLAHGDEPTRAAVKRIVLDPRRANLRAAVGTDSATAAERGHNLYETPAEAMRTLLALERFSRRVKEPACGRGAIARPLEDAGYEVDLADLVDYGTFDRDGVVQRVEDFLASRYPSPETPAAPAKGGSRGVSTSPTRGEVGTDIVTNPPYGTVLNAFVAHALRVHRPRKMALLLNLNFLAGFDDPDRRFAMDANPPARIHVFTRRLPMMHRDGWDGPEAASRMNCAWFVWEMDSAGRYAGPAVLNRVDWKDFEGAPALPPAPGLPAISPSRGEIGRKRRAALTSAEIFDLACLSNVRDGELFEGAAFDGAVALGLVAGQPPALTPAGISALARLEARKVVPA